MNLLILIALLVSPAQDVPSIDKRFDQGLQKFANQDYGGAKIDLEAVLEAQPRHREARKALIYVLDQPPHESEAPVRHARILVEQTPDMETYEMLGSVLGNRNRKAEALAAWRKALELGSKEPHVIKGVFFWSLETGDTEGLAQVLPELGSGSVLLAGCVFAALGLLGIGTLVLSLWTLLRKREPFVEPPEERPDWHGAWTIIASIAVLALQLPAAVLFIAVGAEQITAGLVGAVVGAGLTVLLVVVVLCRRRGRSVRALAWRAPQKRWDSLTLPLAGYPVAILLLVAIGALEALAFGELPEAQETAQQIAALRSPLSRVVAMLAMVVAAPVAEELVFRGVLQRWLRNRMPPIRAILVASAVFAFAHLDAVHAPQLFALGLVLGWVHEKSASLRPNMILHGIINGVSALVIALTNWI